MSAFVVACDGCDLYSAFSQQSHGGRTNHFLDEFSKAIAEVSEFLGQVFYEPFRVVKPCGRFGELGCCFGE